MSNYFDTKDKSLCCGCTACVNICPKQCISMEEDKDGFSYPVIDKDKCIDCGLCVKVCPFADGNSEKLKHKAADKCYAMVLEDKEEVCKSSSGGAFTAIMNAFCKENFVIFGAEMCKDLKVRHTSAETREEAKKFRKSKYIKSDTYEAYSLAKKALQEGKKVLFTGTGCQIAGLKGFLQKDYENLLTVDLVCHGVPSQLSFDKYIEGLERKYKKKIVDYTFRAKKKFNSNANTNSIYLTFENGENKCIQSSDDSYNRAFIQ